jgi:2-keto-4-pentenoate hydratase/2-oxohepta-3-ene-1,7-dioic acid hydratase in catechol pathway
MDKIICLGKNYADHTSEMKEAQPDKPVLFIKPPSCFLEVSDKSIVQLPWHRGEIHHELELVFKLYKKNVIGLGIGLDLTLRDLQKKLKAAGHPWEIAKSFTNSALVTPIKGTKDFGDWKNLEFTLKINGELKQAGRIADAIMGPDEIIHHINNHFPIRDSDLVFTGTPKGVGPLHPGDQIELAYGPTKVSFRLGENFDE